MCSQCSSRNSSLEIEADFSAILVKPPPAVIGKFKSLKSNYERIDFVSDFMDLPTIPTATLLNRKIKNDETSLLLRKKGNQLFVDAKDLMEALQLYTESIAFAESGSSYLGIAYGNRSAVLYHTCYYKECLEDIDRAIQNHFPAHLIEKLLKRQQLANLKKKKNQKSFRYYEPIPVIANKHNNIPAAANSIDINKNQTFGTHIIAKRKIKAGEILSVETPYMVLVNSGSKFLHCHECLEFCLSMIPCSNCAMALYCSDKCRETAFKSYHQYECKIGSLEQENALFLKLTLLGAKEANDVQDTSMETYRSDLYKEIYRLKTNVDTLDPYFVFFWSKVACKAFYSLKHFTNFIQDLNIDEKTLKDMLLRNALIENTNGVGIDKYKKIFGVISKDKVGSAICVFTSRYNHSCAPNCVYISYGKNIVIRSIKDIKDGEQCTISYTGSYMEKNHLERQRILKSNYCFVCKCIACEKKWPIYSDLVSKQAFEDVVEEFNIKTNHKNVQSFWKLSYMFGEARTGMRADKESMLSKAFHLQALIEEPSKAVAYLRELIFNLFVLYGNQSVQC